MCYQLLATKALKDETMKVYTALSQGDLKQARYAVSMVVGRDTEVLDETGVTKAAVETVAENASDGVIAPLLFLAIGGAPLGFFYKAVNTMDSMVGYKNDKYLYFGRAAGQIRRCAELYPREAVGSADVGGCLVLRTGRRECLEDIFKRQAQSQQSQFRPYRGGSSGSAAYSAGRERILFWKAV